MPIIEYFHPTGTYRVSIVRTVEWSAFVSTMAHPDAPYVPSVGYNEDSTPDSKVVLETTDKNEAFRKMTELWNEWSSKNFSGVTHC